MKYNLYTDNYRTFETFAADIMQPRSYFIPFSDAEKAADADIRNERYTSDRVRCLSGEWDFVYYSNCLDIPEKFDTDTVSFDKVPVPSTWQHTGYEPHYYVNTRYQFTPNPPKFPEDCPAGVYRKVVNIDDAGRHYYLTFLGIAGAADVFVNGRFAGYSEGSHNTAEYDITQFVTRGENEIVVLNHKWSNGTYLECQDMFRCNGIFRDVLLTETGDDTIYDFELKTTYLSERKYNLEIIPALKLSGDCQLTAAVYDGKEEIKCRTVKVDFNNKVSVNFDMNNIKEWSAEAPALYDVVLTLSNKNGVSEAVHRRIGFKHIEISGNVFLFNGRPIKLLGVNHHDTNPKTGYVLTAEQMEKDIALVKEYNGNCIRTSHYPPDPVFLDLCDEYGIYVIDEADIETHGCEIELRKPGACSHNPAWKGHYLDRVSRMYERDKNHPCVTMWSLGNEAHGYSNQDLCYKYLKERTEIPVHYEAVCRTSRWAYDVISKMYDWPAVCERVAKGSGLSPKYYKKPYFLCEYAHAMGVGAGELERYVKCFYSADNMLGGCIWEFADHAVYHENGQYEYTYGGDHGELKHDSNFCVDGLFFPDRKPHPGALQMKACYRPVRAEKISSQVYKFKNHRYFTPARMTVVYRILSEGELAAQGSLKILLAPQEEKEYSIPAFELKENLHQVIQFAYFEDKIAVAMEEIELSGGALEHASGGKAPAVRESEQKLFIDFDCGSMIFDRSNGNIDSLIVNGKELINQVPDTDFRGLGLQFFRAPLDNDMYFCEKWKKYGLDRTSEYVSGCRYTLDEEALVINETVKVQSPAVSDIATVSVKYTIHITGEILAGYHIKSSSGVRWVPRFGVQLEMPRWFSNVRYYGLGPVVNLPDFKEHALTGIYESTVYDMYSDYIKPQESGTRCEVRFAEVTDDDGTGLRFEAVGRPFAFSAAPFTPLQCAKAGHRENLTDSTVCVNIDAEVMGAGSNSCGPIPSSQYRLGKLAGKEFKFIIKPITSEK